MRKITPLVKITQNNSRSYYVDVQNIASYPVYVSRMRKTPRSCRKIYANFKMMAGDYLLTTVTKQVKGKKTETVGTATGLLAEPNSKDSAHIYIREVFRALLIATGANDRSMGRSAQLKKIGALLHNCMSAVDSTFDIQNAKQMSMLWIRLIALSTKLYEELSSTASLEYLRLPFATYFAVFMKIEDALFDKCNIPEGMISILTEIGIIPSNKKETIMTVETEKVMALGKIWEIIPKAGIKTITVSDGTIDVALTLVNQKNQTVTSNSKLSMNEVDQMNLKKLTDASAIMEAKAKVQATAHELGLTVEQLLVMIKM